MPTGQSMHTYLYESSRYPQACTGSRSPSLLLPGVGGTTHAISVTPEPTGKSLYILLPLMLDFSDGVSIDSLLLCRLSGISPSLLALNGELLVSVHCPLAFLFLLNISTLLCP